MISYCGRYLAARELDPVMRGEFPHTSTQIARQQIVSPHTEDFGDHVKLQVRNATILVFQSGHRFATGIPPEQLQLHGKAVLCPAFAEAQLADLRTDYVQVRGVVFDARDPNSLPTAGGCALLHSFVENNVCNSWADLAKICMLEGQAVVLIRNMKQSEGEILSRKVVARLPHFLPGASFLSSKTNIPALPCPVATTPAPRWHGHQTLCVLRAAYRAGETTSPAQLCAETRFEDATPSLIAAPQLYFKGRNARHRRQGHTSHRHNRLARF